MEEDGELFEVECLLSTRVKDDKRYYKVRWKGFPPEEDTWEPEENVQECEEVLDAFWKKRRRNANKRQKMRRYRLMSEEEDQDTPSTSCDNKGTESFGDIEPLGLTRQASKELAMCLNKSRNTTKRISESSSQAGSDVFMENDVSSKSTLLSSQNGSDITASDNEVFSQSPELKSSETGSDVLNESKESTNEINPTTDVIDVFSLDSSLNQSDTEVSKAKKIEVISLLSDSEDTEGDGTGTGSQISGSLSLHVHQSRDSSPVICRESFKTPESTPSKSSPQSNEAQNTQKVTNHSPVQSPGSARESEEEDPFVAPVRRRNRFELSLKKNRKRKLNKIESLSSESPKTQEEVLNVGVKNEDIFSEENVVKTKGKTQLQILKESMIELENSEKNSEKSDCIFQEINEPRAKRAIIKEKISNESSVGDVCPKITELKSIMHEIARNKYRQLGEGNLGDGNEMGGRKNRRSLNCSLSETKTSETMSCGNDKGVEKMVLEDDNRKGEQDGLNLYTCDLSEGMMVEDEELCAADERSTSEEDIGKTSCNDEEEMNEMISKSQVISESETEENDEDLKGVEKDEINHKEELFRLEKGVDSKRISNEEQENSNSEAISEKEEEKEENMKKRTLAIVPSSTKKALVLSSESTTRVLKKFRFLAAKTRESKSIEVSTSLTTKEKKNNGKNDSKAESNSNLENIIGDDENETKTKLVGGTEELNIGNEKCQMTNLNENESQVERKIEGINGVKTGNKAEEKKKKNDELELIYAKTKPVYKESAQIDSHIKSKVEDTNNHECSEINNFKDQTEKMTNVGNLTHNKIKPAPTENIKTLPYKSGDESLSMTGKNCEPSTKEKASEDITLIEEDIMNLDSDICTTKRPNSSPAVESFSMHDTISDLRCQGDDGAEETLALNFQKHSEVDSSNMEEKDKQTIKKTRKMLKKSQDKTAPGKRVKRKKILQLEPKNSDSKDLISNQGVEKRNISSSSAKSKSQYSKTLKRTKTRKHSQMNMIKEDDNSTGKKSNPPLQNAQEQGKKSLILDANFSSNLTSGDLIGAIIDEGDKESTLKHDQKKSSTTENNDSKDLIAARQEKGMIIEDDEDFDFELEDFPLEKLLNEEDDVDVRYIPSPPVEPLEVPFGRRYRRHEWQFGIKKSARMLCAHKGRETLGDRSVVNRIVYTVNETRHGNKPLTCEVEGELVLYFTDGGETIVFKVEEKQDIASVKTAIRDGDEMTVRAALAGGLELDTLDGASGMTLLMLATASGQDGVVELFLRRKADVNACQKNGMTALMHACEQGYPETAHVLLICGADINRQQIAGETALMKACKKGHTDVVEVLLRNGADTRMESKSGHTAQQFAIRGYPELSSLIEEHEKRFGHVVEEAILKCLGDTVSLCKPAILCHRCVVPREGQQMTFPFHYTPLINNKDVDIILFCIKAVFDDVVSLLFGEDNGVRGVLLNNKPQIPLLHGVRSIFAIDPKSRQNTITLQTHKCSNPASRIILCIYTVQSKS